MKTITNNYKQEIAKLGKEIDSIIHVFDNDKLTTENSNLLITEDNLNLIVEQFNEEIKETITASDIYNISIITKGNLLSTLMKELDFEIKQDLKVGDVVDCQFGLKVNNNYEYINYGKYIIYSKEKNEDIDTYSYVAFDCMLLSMIKANDISIIQGITIKKAIENICEKIGLEINISNQDIQNLPNLEKIINDRAFTDVNITYRNVLDMICQVLGISMIINNRELQLKPINRISVDTIDEMYLKDTNVKFNEKYIINSVLLSRSDGYDTINRTNQASVNENGLHQFEIKDNLILMYEDWEDYIDEIYEQLNGLEFYTNDYISTGITYFDWLDFYNVKIGENTYKCLMLNDEIKIQQGLEESIYTEKPEETVNEYTTSTKTDKEVSFIVDKQNGEIKSKVSKGDVINEINLDESGAIIKAEKISLEGKEINLTSDDIKINSTHFDVDENGNITATGGTLGGWTINIEGLRNNDNFFIKNNGLSNIYTFSDILILRLILQGTITLTPGTPEFEHFDLNNDGVLDSIDLLLLRKMILEIE